MDRHDQCFSVIRALDEVAVTGDFTSDHVCHRLVAPTGGLVARFLLSGWVGSAASRLFEESARLAVRSARRKTTLQGIAALLASVFVVSPGLAQSEQGATVLEEIVVTARKREESLQDVPISITAFSGEDIQAQGIQRLEYLAPSVPNFHFSQVPTGNDQFFMRGIGNGINFGFENAVGQVLDGFFYGRSRIGRAAFLDLERVEVLLGPQGAILGKNNSAGAINLTTAKPTEAFESRVSVNGNFEGNDGFSLEGYISGPMSDSVKGRIAIRYDDFDGYFENLALDENEQTQDDFTVRGTLLWSVPDETDITLSYQRVDFERGGMPRELFNCGPVLTGQLAVPGFTAECDADYRTSVNGPVAGVATQDLFTHEQDMAHLTLDRTGPDGHRFTTLAGYMQYKYDDFFDGDSTPSENRSFRGRESFAQLLQENRISKTGKKFDYTIGIFFLSTEQDSDFLINFAAAADATRFIASRQDTNTRALFGEITFHLTDTIDATLGTRYTWEEKELLQEQSPARLYTTTRIPTTSTLSGRVSNVHLIFPERSETNVSPSLDIRWRPNDDTMFYGSVRRGFKSGGFDMLLNAPQAVALDRVEYEEEKSLSYEIGTKLSLADGRARLNIALFDTTFEGLQQSVFVSFGTFQVGNAAEARTRGIELGFDWQPVERLTVNADFAYLNAEYTSYENGPCYAGQSTATCIATSGRSFQNLTGTTLPWAPKTSAAVSATYTWPLLGGINFVSFVQLAHSAEYSIATDLDPIFVQDAYQKINIRLALASTGEQWEFALIGRNLTDERILLNGSDTGPDAYTAFVAPPRVVGLQYTHRF